MQHQIISNKPKNVIHALSIESFYEACTETKKENVGWASPEKENE